MDKATRTSLGFSDRQASALTPGQESRVARVAADFGLNVEVWTPEPCRAVIPPRIRQAGIAVGDWVVLDKSDEAPVVEKVLPRQGALLRQAAGTATRAQCVGANLDVIFVVTSMNREFSLPRLERYLTAVSQAEAEPVILLTKRDLVIDPDPFVEPAGGLGAPVIPLAVLEDDVEDALSSWLRPGTTVAFVGSSGVGKSTIINRVLGQDVQRIGEIRPSDDEGRHTTTHRQLLMTPGGAILLDTPGMREFHLWGTQTHDDGFQDIADLTEECRFRNCTHREEPGCAVREAIDAGVLDARRLRSWHKLQIELETQRGRQKERGK